LVASPHRGDDIEARSGWFGELFERENVFWVVEAQNPGLLVRGWEENEVFSPRRLSEGTTKLERGEIGRDQYSVSSDQYSVFSLQYGNYRQGLVWRSCRPTLPALNFLMKADETSMGL